MVPDAAHANYVVDGTLQVIGKRYRATVRVLDRDAGQHFVSDRFNGELDDVFQAQDDLAYRIYNLVRFAVYDREFQTADMRPGAE